MYKEKNKVNVNIERFKARLVVKGYTQQNGVDYNEIFSHVVKLTTVRAPIATAAKKNLTISQLYVNNTFLHRDLHVEVYTEVPSGLEVNSMSGLQGEQVFVWIKISHQTTVCKAN